VRRPRLEVADVFHRHGADWRPANAGHVSLGQLQVISAIEQCRSAALVGLQPTGLTRGGHVERCEDCGHSRIAYNSCRNRHCPKCQGAAAQDWLAAREADLLPVGYFHVVFTLPAEISPIAYQNNAVVYDPLFRTAAETLLTIAPTGQARGLKAPRSQAPRRASAPPPCSTPGDRRSPTIRTCILSCRAAGYRLTARAG
jgi:hypothetical protein